jgi:uncharacterized protein (DUF608 family)
MGNRPESSSGIARRAFLQLSIAGAGAFPVRELFAAEPEAPVQAALRQPAPASTGQAGPKFGVPYAGERLDRIAFPLGGLGAGMVCLEGTGGLSNVSVRHQPDVFNSPLIFAAFGVKGHPELARVLEAPVPTWKLFGGAGTANGSGGTSWGLPRLSSGTFLARFPFAMAVMRDRALPVEVTLTGWSPFEPNDPDASSLPVAALEYRIVNRGRTPLDGVFSFHAKNFMSIRGNAEAVRPIDGGFVLWGGPHAERPWDEGSFAVVVDEPGTAVDHAWFRGGWWDPLTLTWKAVTDATAVARSPIPGGDKTPSPGGSIYVPVAIAPGASRTIRVKLAWYVPMSSVRAGRSLGAPPNTPESIAKIPASDRFRPWYAGKFPDIGALVAHWRAEYDRLRARSLAFSECLHDSSLPPEVIEAVSANLSILKSPTVLRQDDGRMGAWEGCGDTSGCCAGTCTHVWNYAQAVPHLFPSLERTLRETEFGPSQADTGHQMFRSALPIRPVEHDFHAAADGQLGGIMKVHRDWRISGDTEWLRRLWPKVRKSLDFCIQTWDPQLKGIVEEPHHNTYDIEFWGPNGMCTSFYLGALHAAVAMGEALGEDVTRYRDLIAKGTTFTEKDLWNGEYFVQKIQWEGLRAGSPTDAKSMVGDYTPEAQELLKREGPKYQYGSGCLADGVLGSWMAMVCGVGQVLDRAKVEGHLRAVHTHNLKRDLSTHSNPQRPTFAAGKDGGLLICTWPKGGKLTLPFVYSDEVWTGIEYQVASHLMLMGRVAEGLDIVRVARARYDGKVRNPFDEYECGHWYARAMSSYGLLQGMTGARYDAIDKVLYLEPRVAGDFHAFLSTATGYGTVGVRGGKPFFDVKAGKVDVREIKYVAARKPAATPAPVRA